MKIVTDRPQLEIDGELVEICREIFAEGKTDDEWSEIESCDMFQSSHYCGGYDGVEQEFSFSYFEISEKEWWFQLPLADVKKVIEGELKYIDLSEPQ